MRYVVIMAGGSGTRLWPLSRQGMPKQMLSLVGGKSLLRLAYERIQGCVPDANVLVCTGAAYADTVAAQLPEIPVDNLLGEPVGRDSLNAVAWPAAVLAHRDPDAVVAMITADQLIEPVAAFREALEVAFRIAEGDGRALVTFGVVPTFAHTGFGYLHRGAALDGHPHACEVQEFREKPDQDLAERYLASGEYWWNSGLFVWRAATLLRQLEILLPETHAAVTDLAEHPEKLPEIYPTLHKTSVDYGVMEPVSRGLADGRVVAVELPATFHDVGNFAALAEQLTQDDAGTVAEGLVAQIDGQGNLILNRSSGRHLVATAGLTGMIVVHTDEITMVCPLEKCHKVKELVAEAASRAGEQYA